MNRAWGHPEVSCDLFAADARFVGGPALKPTDPGYLNPGPYRVLFPHFRSVFAQKRCTFTHFFRERNIYGIQVKQSVLRGVVKR